MRFTILCAGAFGTALSVALCKAGREVHLWSRNEHVIEALRTLGENAVYLPGLRVPDGVLVHSDMSAALAGSEAVLFCVPAQGLRSLCDTVRHTRALSDRVPIVVCSKGIENVSLKLASEVVGEIFPQNPILILSGPTLAKEMAAGLPCAMVLACKSPGTMELLASQLSTPTVSIVCSDDLIGVQVGAAMKNVIAIACGIVTGMGLGHNAAAIVVVQGMAEIRAVCEAKQGKAETLTGLGCLGDLVLTCTTPGSRNMSFGMLMGKEGLDTSQRRPVLVEGAESASAIMNMGNVLGLELPICSAVAQLLYGQLSIKQAVTQMLSAPVKSHLDVQAGS
ncbi:MAG: NAD(P)H-dependent glycerol-3-phosphate dehydrogenase [Anaplasma sp.]